MSLMSKCLTRLTVPRSLTSVRRYKNRVGGFTVIELLVAMLMVAILASIAVPSFQTSIKKNRVQTEQRDLKRYISEARSKAISESKFVGVCGSDDATTCNGTDDWSNGWIIFLDDGSGAGATIGDGVLDGDEALVSVYEYRGENKLIVADASDNAVLGISFDSRGRLDFVQRGGGDSRAERLTLRICEPEDDVLYARAVVLGVTGRAFDSFDNDANGIFEDANGADLVCP